MAFVVADRVQETCSSPGTGSVTLLGAVTGYRTFSAGIGNANSTFYAIADQTGANWEVGVGTYSTSGNALSRTTVLASSNAGSLVNFSSGTQNVWGDYPATNAVFTDPSGNISRTIGDISGITGGILSPDYMTFDVAPTTIPTAPGSLYWDNTDGNQTLNLIMAGGAATQQIGEEQYYRIKASSAITNGQVVMFTGTVGASGALTGAPATGLTAATASYVMGIATQDIALNGWGYVTSFGLVRNLNTNAFTAGSILYLDPTVAGGLTTTIPSAPNPKVQVCACIYQSATVGSYFVRVSIGGSFGMFEGDVQITSPTTNQVLQWAGTKWQNASLPTNAVTRTEQTATAGQTTFTVSYTVGLLYVFQNGTLLGTADYTATNGTSVVLTTGANVGDILTFEAYAPYSLASATGTGLAVLQTSPTLITPNIGTPSAGTLTNCTGLPLGTGVTGTLPGVNGGTPAGAVNFFAMNTAPSGYIKANGAAVSRTTYATLFSAIGTTFGTGDGSTTFNVPDFRGYFPRGWVDNGTVDSGRAFGSTQTDAFQGHKHSMDVAGPYMTPYPSGGGMSSGGGARFEAPAVGSPSTDGTNGTPRTASETRPSNVALLACIKY